MSYEGTAMSSGKEPVVKHVIVPVAEGFEELEVASPGAGTAVEFALELVAILIRAGAAGGIRARIVFCTCPPTV
jgi:hypothetical protein